MRVGQFVVEKSRGCCGAVNDKTITDTGQSCDIMNHYKESNEAETIHQHKKTTKHTLKPSCETCTWN